LDVRTVVREGRAGVHDVDGYAALVEAVVDQWVKDALCDPARLRVKAHRVEAEEAKRAAHADLRSLARHPERWGIVTFLCEHTGLAPADVVRGLHNRAGLPYQRMLHLTPVDTDALAA
jgi:hypothetical protein